MRLIFVVLVALVALGLLADSGSEENGSSLRLSDPGSVQVYTGGRAAEPIPLRSDGEYLASPRAVRDLDRRLRRASSLEQRLDVLARSECRFFGAGVRHAGEEAEVRRQWYDLLLAKVADIVFGEGTGLGKRQALSSPVMRDRAALYLHQWQSQRGICG